jgi:hypothetical protein
MATVPNKVVDALIKISVCRFGGKERGRFRLGLKELEIISGKRVVYEDFLRLITVEAAERGYLFARLDTTNYLFMKIGPLTGWRKAPVALATDHKIKNPKKQRKVEP